MQINLSELREFLTSLEQTEISELTLKSEDFELTVRRGLKGDVPIVAIEATGHTGQGNPTPLPSVAAPVSNSAAPHVPASGPTRSASDGAAAPAPVPPPAADKTWVEITSPMVGTFYRAPGPDEPPFVDVGDRIRPGQTVCIIEAMKLMNELEAEVAGEILEVLVQNGQPVEYGQTLMRVSPL
ncbi:acetyl-CoA carboxylase, biotin carboxyl carrier protein [Leptolyngbya sp. 'hensonii']|uniref:acetyl-CoA carboxylase biotin carboxyl carrier protein n=1 Tax=Leptolyngbya sp. 'hensonii' TaxID=1922337 RepID=UPI00094F535B|nr:acetyl-CoA carboxylase biotin carboxyl carrier protein [Leptolyngbya sp. 'hensonii']OLP19384.1 acetyl-CoA carboxylase, biotin carboxyl carrier protein [Leptolyngbya sp. 'hensonii']